MSSASVSDETKAFARSAAIVVLTAVATAAANAVAEELKARWAAQRKQREESGTATEDAAK